MAFTGETKFGLTDGQHLGNWSAAFPVFARIVKGDLYAVAREDNSDGINFGKVVFSSRAWLKGNLYNAFPAEADLFADKTNLAEDTSIPAGNFVKTTNADGLIAHPDPLATSTTPAATTTADNSTDAPAATSTASDAGTTTVDPSLYQTALVPTLGTGSGSAQTAWGAKLFLGVIAVVAVVIGAVYLVRKRKRANGGQ